MVRISPASGVTENFSAPVVYTVTAADSSTASYTVITKREAPNTLVYIGGSDDRPLAIPGAMLGR